MTHRHLSLHRSPFLVNQRCSQAFHLQFLQDPRHPHSVLPVVGGWSFFSSHWCWRNLGVRCRWGLRYRVWKSHLLARFSMRRCRSRCPLQLGLWRKEGKYRSTGLERRTTTSYSNMNSYSRIQRFLRLDFGTRAASIKRSLSSLSRRWVDRGGAVPRYPA